MRFLPQSLALFAGALLILLLLGCATQPSLRTVDVPSVAPAISVDEDDRKKNMKQLKRGFFRELHPEGSRTIGTYRKVNVTAAIAASSPIVAQPVSPAIVRSEEPQPIVPIDPIYQGEVIHEVIEPQPQQFFYEYRPVQTPMPAPVRVNVRSSCNGTSVPVSQQILRQQRLSNRYYRPIRAR